MAFTTLSTVSAKEKKKRLVKSGKDSRISTQKKASTYIGDTIINRTAVRLITVYVYD